jgi:rsbT co-antagonist protein RsbR
MTSWYQTFKEHEEDIVQAMADRLRRELPPYAAMPMEVVKQRVAAGCEPYGRDLDEPSPSHFANYWRETAYQRATQGLTLEQFMPVLLYATEEILAALRNFTENSEEKLDLMTKGYAITASGIAAVYIGYEQYKDDIIASQSNALAEVSTPIVPIYEGILVLPVVGSIDSRRAGQIMEGLLEGISAYSADVVIMDITGVPVIDTGVANYLLQSARAARLLGSTVVLVGIGAEIAQTIVQLGIDLTGIVTRANLQSGIEFALATQGLAIRGA